MTINDIPTEIRLKSTTEKEKGTDFERLMKLWFLTDPRYSNLEKVWLWEEFLAHKDFGGKDLGIDLVACTEYGDYWAIQCKCYAEDADKVFFDAMLSHKEEAEVALGVKLDRRSLEGKKASSIDYSQSFKVTDPEKQEEIFAWYKEYTEKFISFLSQ